VFREDIECLEGLILVPGRSLNGWPATISLPRSWPMEWPYSIEAQSASCVRRSWRLKSGVAGDVVGALCRRQRWHSCRWLVANHEIEKRMREQAGRIALTLMAMRASIRGSAGGLEVAGSEEAAEGSGLAQVSSRADIRWNSQVGTEPPQASPPAQ